MGLDQRHARMVVAGPARASATASKASRHHTASSADSDLGM